MLDLKYQEKNFGSIAPDEILKTAWGLLVKLHVITGWTIPADEMIQNELVKQFALKLREGYGNVNSEEMEYAFRNNSEVKDWGKAMNLSLIDEVMQPYLSKRYELSKIEEQKKAVALLPDSTTNDVSDDEFISSIYTLYKTVGDFKTIPLLAYDILDKRKTWTKEDKLKVCNWVDEQFGKQKTLDLYRQVAVAAYFDSDYKK